jgi:hypothetical protein
VPLCCCQARSEAAGTAAVAAAVSAALAEQQLLLHCGSVPARGPDSSLSCPKRPPISSLPQALPTTAAAS